MGPKNESLGIYVRERRLNQGLSLNDAAERSGLHLSYWSKLENGLYRRRRSTSSPSPGHWMSPSKTSTGWLVTRARSASHLKPYLRTKYETARGRVRNLTMLNCSTPLRHPKGPASLPAQAEEGQPTQ